MIRSLPYAALFLLLSYSTSFAPLLPNQYSYLPGPRRRGLSTPSPGLSLPPALQCICIHCKLVDVCAAYHFVEEKHSQPHIWRPNEGSEDEKPPFEPRDGSPTIEVNIRQVDAGCDREGELNSSVYNLLSDMGFFTSGGGPTGAAPTADPAIPKSLSRKVTTVEYDVVKCADFVEEHAKWQNNMPEEIRLANPSFIPP